MSRIRVKLTGAAKVFPNGIGKSLGLKEDTYVKMENDTFEMQVDNALPLIDSVTVVAIYEFLKKMWKRDTTAPSVGAVGREDGVIEVTAESGVALLRIYSRKAHDLNVEVSAGDYINYKGEVTDEPWETTILLPGQTLSLELIQSNAVTLALYN